MVSKDPKNRIDICISSKPFLPGGAIIVPEQRYSFLFNVGDENESDINAFLEECLVNARDFRPPEELQNIKTRFVERASGVFKWIAWATDFNTNPGRRVMCLIESKEYVNFVFEAIEGVPEELSDIYQTIVDEIHASEVECVARFFECLILARRPLTVEDIHYANCLDAITKYKSKEEFARPPQFCKTEEQLMDRVTRISSGLVRKVSMAVDLGCPTGLVNLWGYLEIVKLLLAVEEIDLEGQDEWVLHPYILQLSMAAQRS